MSDRSANLQSDNTTAFVYRGWHFSCGANAVSPGLYRPVVRVHMPGPGGEPAPLPQDTDPYGTAAEAMRHAQQQAMRWVHDRTGDGQGQF